jgi:hypothetical protein
LAVNPFETDDLLRTKSSLFDAVLYRNNWLMMSYT